MGNSATFFLVALALCLPLSAGAQSLGENTQSAPMIYSIAPASGAAGTELTIIGRGFSASNTVKVGEMIIPQVPIARWAGIACVQQSSTCHPGINQSLVVKIPRNQALGPSRISVQNDKGVTNALIFTVMPN